MKFIRRTCWIFVVLFILFIFMNSLTPAVTSKALSGNITSLILNSLHQININVDYEMLHHIIRKLAHFSEYSLLGFLILFAISTRPFIQSKILHFTLFFLVPICDEFIQKFTPGRSCEIGDMLIDASGMIFGCLIYLGVTAIFKTRIQDNK